MPVYEYICKDCKKKFEVLRAIKDPRTGVACPKCRSRKVERHWTSVFVETARKS
jgi:putative FmdB family regulatory protein